MKKLILIISAIGFITMAATTKKSTPKEKAFLTNENYNACISACNTCIKSCSTCEIICSKDTKMPLCTQFCKDCITACKAFTKAMSTNRENVKSESEKCVIACEKCANECEMFTIDPCKKSAADCRILIQLCDKFK